MEFPEFRTMPAQDFETRLIKLWDRADKLESGSPEYNTIVDEVIAIHSYTSENSIKLPPEILARF